MDSLRRAQLSNHAEGMKELLRKSCWAPPDSRDSHDGSRKIDNPSASWPRKTDQSNQVRKSTYFNNFDGKFELRVGFQVVQHAIEGRRVHVPVAWVAGRVTGRVSDDVVPRIGDSLLKQRNFC